MLAPLQSGADTVLRRMRRWHTRSQYRSRALHIAERVSPLGLGADVITGFPAESSDEHEETRALIEELPFTYLHVFPFSPRSGTPAAKLNRERPVPQRIAGERARELRELALEKGERYRRARAGQEAAVLPEGNQGGGLTEDYLRVEIRPEDEADRARSPRHEAEGTCPVHRDRVRFARAGTVRDGDILRGILRAEGTHLYIPVPTTQHGIQA